MDRRYDKLLFITIIIISLFGLIMIYSSSYIWANYKYNNPYKFVITQSVFVILGVIIMLILSKLDYKIYLLGSYLYQYFLGSLNNY